jgi:hypothetical protein
MMTTIRSEPTGPRHTKAELLDRATDIWYKHISVVIVWNIDLETPAYYMLFLRKYGDWLGNVTHLEYLNAKRK